MNDFMLITCLDINSKHFIQVFLNIYFSIIFFWLQLESQRAPKREKKTAKKYKYIHNGILK